MWRFMILTFGFLGFAFYELSGGADYAPADNSIQARAGQEPADPALTPERRPESLVSIEDLRTTRLENTQPATPDRVEVTLASANSGAIRSETVRALPSAEQKAARLTASRGTDSVDKAVAEALTDPAATVELDSAKIWPGAIELFARQQEQQAATRALVPTGSDIREVTGNVVNMRAGPGTEHVRVTSLSRGTEVAVLDSTDDGWLRLRVTQTGEEGWMADWLVSEAAN